MYICIRIYIYIYLYIGFLSFFCWGLFSIIYSVNTFWFVCMCGYVYAQKVKIGVDREGNGLEKKPDQS